MIILLIFVVFVQGKVSNENCTSAFCVRCDEKNPSECKECIDNFELENGECFDMTHFHCKEMRNNKCFSCDSMYHLDFNSYQCISLFFYFDKLKKEQIKYSFKQNMQKAMNIV